MANQKEIIAVELHDKELDRYTKSEYVVISRDEYNKITKQFVACEVVYSTDVRPYFILIKVTGLRRNSKVNTLNIHTLKKDDESTVSQECVGKVSNKEFLEIAQAFNLNLNFPL